MDTKCNFLARLSYEPKKKAERKLLSAASPSLEKNEDSDRGEARTRCLNCLKAGHANCVNKYSKVGPFDHVYHKDKISSPRKRMKWIKELFEK